MPDGINLLPASDKKVDEATDKKESNGIAVDNAANKSKGEAEGDTEKKKGLLERIAGLSKKNKTDKKAEDESHDENSELKEEKNENYEKESGDVSFVTGDLIIPASKEIFRRLVILGLIFILCIILSFAAYIFLLIKEESLLDEMKDMESASVALDEAIAGYNDTQAQLEDLKENISFAEELLSNHVYWTKFFDVLENYTIPEIHYTAFDMDIGGGLKLISKADNYDAVANQLFIFSDYPEYFEEVYIDSLTLNEDTDTGQVDGIRMIISLRVNPNVFYINNE